MRLDWRQRARLECWAADNLHSPTIDPPDYWPEHSRLRSDGQLPIYSGDHAIGLAGLYSVVNALKLLLAEVGPLQPIEERLLLEVGWNFMSGREAMAPHKGMRSNTFSRMAEAMTFAFSTRRGIWIRCERFERPRPTPKSITILLERSVVARRVAMILLGRGHYSVLRGYTSASWLLFDAMGRRWIQRASAGGDRIAMPILTFSRSS